MSTLSEKTTESANAQTSSENRLLRLKSFGQSIWLDYIRRDLITTGELKRMIEEDGLCGMTSNPAIFEKAILGGDIYNDFIHELKREGNLDAKAIYERLAIRDIRDAADQLRPVYDATRARDGYVSLEVAPTLANDTQATIEEARRLWEAVDRPNLMIKVPGTGAGLPAIETLVGQGLNINVTLLFSQSVYADVAHTYIRGLQAASANGLNLRRIASVASFFVSRIDTLVDKQIDEKLPSASDEQKKLLESVRSKVAIANAKLAYEIYKQIFSGPEWNELASKGAQTQRVLWASTSTKNPKLRDVLYVEELIGRDTVNTIPPQTYEAFKDHGVARASLEENLGEARRVMANLAQAGISIDKVTEELVIQGVKLFVEPFEKLLEAVRAA
jgi:transaldolase